MDPSRVVFAVVSQAAEAPTEAVAATAVPDYGFWYSILHAGLSEKLVMLVLVAFSVVSWAIVAFKLRHLRRAYRDSETFLDTFWSSKRLDAIFQKSETLAQSPVSQVFRAGYIELAKLKKRDKDKEKDKDDEGSSGEEQISDLPSIERSMRRAAAAEMTSLESMIPFLATVGSTAPFIGLLGTVVGIMSSFQDIGAMGNANLATVAPGIGGALVATAFGLFAAIPAVIAFNYFQAKLRVIGTEMENFSADFLNIVKRHFF